MQIERRHAAIYKRVKALLPRRESERRSHPLFRHCDILSAVETRISMLNITYMKYIQNNMCCFIPGKVLDELERVLNIVEQKTCPPKAHEILQELRDISSMAMEYFDEKILPSIKGQANQTGSTSYQAASVAQNKGPKVYFVQPVLQDEIRKLTKTNKRQRAHINCLSKVIQQLYTRVAKQQSTIKAQNTLLQKHTTKLQEQDTRMQQQESALTDIQKRVDEWEHKFVDLSAEITHSREDIVKAMFPIPKQANHHIIGEKAAHKTVIRPRLSHVQTPNTYIVELERKRKASMDYEIPNKLRFIMKRDSAALQLQEKLANKINENITQNIARSIRAEVEDTTRKKNLSQLLSKSVESILHNSIIAAKSRKRRSTEDIDLMNLH